MVQGHAEPQTGSYGTMGRTSLSFWATNIPENTILQPTEPEIR